MSSHPVSIPDFTTVVALDSAHLEQFRLTFPTWVRFRPEIAAQPLLLICDADVPVEEWRRRTDFVQHSRVRLVPWSQPGVSQREKMLTALTLIPGREVDTPWYLKIDTDVVATDAKDWFCTDWFSCDESGREPAFVASPWGYTKPPDAIEVLDDWGDTVPSLACHSRLNLRAAPGATLVSHRRMASWVFWGNTAWTRAVTEWAGDRLPVPSQDTYLWYCAARRNDFFRLAPMRHRGWQTHSRTSSLRRACADALARPAPAAAVDSSLRPKRPGRSMPSLQIYAIRNGAPDYARYTESFLIDYCKRWSYRLEFVDESLAPTRGATWHKLGLAHLLADPFALFIDVNICPLPHSGPIHAALRFDRLNLARHFHSKWAKRRLGEQGLPYDLYQYNVGLVGIPKSVGQSLKAIHDRPQLDPEIAGEQGELNLWLWQTGTPVHVLDSHWSSYWKLGKRFDPSASFVHISGSPRRKHDRALELWELYYGGRSS